MGKTSLETVMVNESAEKAMLRILFTLFNGVVYLDPETVRFNIERGTPYCFSKNDRTINSSIADYLLSNFAWIFLGLVANSDFRDVFVEAVSIEISIDELDRNKVRQIRRDMKSGDITGLRKTTLSISVIMMFLHFEGLRVNYADHLNT